MLVRAMEDLVARFSKFPGAKKKHHGNFRRTRTSHKPSMTQVPYFQAPPWLEERLSPTGMCGQGRTRAPWAWSAFFYFSPANFFVHSLWLSHTDTKNSPHLACKVPRTIRGYRCRWVVHHALSSVPTPPARIRSMVHHRPSSRVLEFSDSSFARVPSSNTSNFIHSSHLKPAGSLPLMPSYRGLLEGQE